MASGHPARAIVFDLDDTLYPYQAFVRSGFRAVGERLAGECGLSAAAVLRVLRRSALDGERGREIQALCARFSLPLSLVPALVTTVREHTPRLRLPQESLRVLASLRHAGWKIGILTNGTPAIQRRKIDALGVSGLVDEVLCAPECGDPAGKPAPAVFRAALERLGATAQQTVLVGDDREADIDGASAVGIGTIHFTAHRTPNRRCDGSCRGVHVERLEQVPVIAERLVHLRMPRHAW